MSEMHSAVEHPTVYAPMQYKGETSADNCKARFESYKILHKESVENPNEYWDAKAKELIDWFSPYHSVSGGDFINGDVNWFAGGKLNACYNCVDRHLATRANDTAIIWESDEPSAQDQVVRYTYAELCREVCRVANVLKERGVRKGDCVTIYMPMIPELAMCMLACARIGAVHSVVFAGFSADSLRDRIVDCNSKVIITANEGRRGGKTIALKNIVDAAVAQTPMVTSVLMYKRTEGEVALNPSLDVWMHEALLKVRPCCPCEWMDSEDTMFILYTSGSTGKPKGVAHTTGGYMLNAVLTTEVSFNLQKDDVYCCAADCGWITGHTYIVYGPLGNGATTVMFESIPTYPNPYRYWDMIQKHKVSKFYTAPTAVRTLMRFETAPIKDYDLSSLQILGSVGEPINPEAWRWYFEHAGRGKCTIADTYWQTETGGHVCTNIHGMTPMKPGSCALPCYGIQFAVLDPKSGQEVTETEAEGVLCIKKPWPSVTRTVYGDHDRYMNVYLRPYPGYYFTGDGCRRDKDGYIWITGRVDDVINPSGHRIGTAEIESALITVPQVSESAVVGFPHEIKGEGIGCFVILKEGVAGTAELAATLKGAVRKAIGPIATPDFIVFSDLPKTRSGKIMRRILRKIASGEEDAIGDVSTLADPSAVGRLCAKFKEEKF